MAKMITGRTAPVSGNSGFNFDQYKAGELFTYDHVTFGSTKVRAFNDADNDTVATGTGFKSDANENPTGGTVHTVTLRVEGVQEFRITDLSVALKTFADLARAGKSNAAWSLLFDDDDKITGTAFDDVLRGFGGDDVLRGGTGDDRLFGQSGEDRLIGGAGADTLIGGIGADQFFYSKSADGGDVVQSFTADDAFVFEGSNFRLGSYSGTLKAVNFRSRLADNHAQDANDYFVYDRATDTLWFDNDGSGAAAPVEIAHLTKDFSMHAADILIV
jgi:Ca2+-binding RTX toxin-like protein